MALKQGLIGEGSTNQELLSPGKDKQQDSKEIKSFFNKGDLVVIGTTEPSSEMIRKMKRKHPKKTITPLPIKASPIYGCDICIIYAGDWPNDNYYLS